VWFEFFREQRRVGVYSFYILDPDFGPGFIRIATYFPFPARVWLNGHAWAKRQADHAGIDNTGSPLHLSPSGSRRSATAWRPVASKRSLIAGWRPSRPR
jgi:hypothetical protein